QPFISDLPDDPRRRLRRPYFASAELVPALLHVRGGILGGSGDRDAVREDAVMHRRWLQSTAVLVGLFSSALAVYIGWQLPHEEDCRGGDACVTTMAIDWARVQWGIPPERYA